MPSLRSLTITLSIFVPSARKMFATRSWVSGRSFRVPCMNIAIAAPNALIDEDDECLFLTAKKNGEAAAGRSYGTNVHFDNWLTHTASLYSPSRQVSELLFAPLATQRLFQGPDLRLVSTTSIIAAPP